MPPNTLPEPTQGQETALRLTPEDLQARKDLNSKRRGRDTVGDKLREALIRRGLWKPTPFLGHKRRKALLEVEK